MGNGCSYNASTACAMTLLRPSQVVPCLLGVDKNNSNGGSITSLGGQTSDHSRDATFHQSRRWTSVHLHRRRNGNQFRYCRVLDLTSCRGITDVGLAQLAIVHRLEVLRLSQCNKISNRGIGGIVMLQQLLRLDVNSCYQLTDSSLELMASLLQLKRLSIAGCYNITDAGLAHVATLLDLCHLSIASCSLVTNLGIACLTSLRSLQHLNIGGCINVTYVALESVACLRSLEYLSLNSCKKITDAGVIKLLVLRHLQQLELRWCPKISDVAIEALKNHIEGMFSQAKSKNHKSKGSEWRRNVFHSALHLLLPPLRAETHNIVSCPGHSSPFTQCGSVIFQQIRCAFCCD